MLPGDEQITSNEKHALRRWILMVAKQVIYSRGNPSVMINSKAYQPNHTLYCKTSKLISDEISVFNV